MQDLTHGSIRRHVLAMAAPIAAGMLLQTLYYIVDLYFVARLGDAPLAGVSATGPVMFVVFALTQILGVGTVALMSHAVGRKDRAEASHVFNRSVALAALCAAATLAGGFVGAGPFMGALGADQPTVAAGVTYLRWFTPGPRAPVRAGRDGFGTPGHRRREADDGRPGGHRCAQYRARADPGAPDIRWVWPVPRSRARSRSPPASC